MPHWCHKAASDTLHSASASAETSATSKRLKDRGTQGTQRWYPNWTSHTHHAPRILYSESYRNEIELISNVSWTVQPCAVVGTPRHGCREFAASLPRSAPKSQSCNMCIKNIYIIYNICIIYVYMWRIIHMHPQVWRNKYERMHTHLTYTHQIHPNTL